MTTAKPGRPARTGTRSARFGSSWANGEPPIQPVAVSDSARSPEKMEASLNAGLRFESQGRYVRSFTRAFFAPFLKGHRTVAPLPRRPWDRHRRSLSVLRAEPQRWRPKNRRFLNRVHRCLPTRRTAKSHATTPSGAKVAVAATQRSARALTVATRLRPG